MHEIITGSFAKELDRCAIEERGIPSLALMERAAHAVYERAKAVLTELAGEEGVGCVGSVCQEGSCPAAADKSTQNIAVFVFCGVGNNGADGLAAGAMLLADGFQNVRAFCYGNPDKATEEFRLQQKRFLAAGGHFETRLLTVSSAYSGQPAGGEAGTGRGACKCGGAGTGDKAGTCDEAGVDDETGTGDGIGVECPALIIDALFGIGLKRPVTGTFAEAIEAMNLLRNAGSYVIAVDMPSGLDADGGRNMCAPLYPVHADETVTFGYAKTGQYLGYGYGNCGRLTVADIGYPAELIGDMLDRRTQAAEQTERPVKNQRQAAEQKTQVTAEMQDMPHASEEITAAAAIETAVFYDTKTAFEAHRDAFQHRDSRANKGTYQKLLIVAGSEGMAGAAYLSGLAAYRSGVGMVKYFGPEENRTILQSLLPEAMYESYRIVSRNEAQSGLQEGTAAALDRSLDWADLVILGPGLSTAAHAEELTELVLRGIAARNENHPLYAIIDADALNILAKKRELLPLLDEHMVLTPHVGELARLAGKTAAEVKEGLPETALALCREWHTNLIAKDCVTVVAECARHAQFYLNLSGSAAMAKAGSGDVLTGALAGAFAVTGSFEEAIPAGVYLHGLAGECAAKHFGEHSTLARDIANALGEAMQEALRRSEADSL